MRLPKFDYHEPKTLDEACRTMAALRNRSSILAGGTDLLVNMKMRLTAPENVVSLGRVGELGDLVWFPDRVEIGACRTVARVQSEEFAREFSAFSKAAGCLGSPLIRNLATVGGNIASARPAADLPPPLMVYDGRVVLASCGGERVVPLSEFFLDVGKTVIAPEEILTRIVVPKPPPCSGAGYVKLGLRKSLEISLVNAAAFIAIDPVSGTVEIARVVMGAVAPVPLRAAGAEKVLIGEEPGEELFARAATAAAQESKPIDNFRGSAEYRRAMVEVLTYRALKIALEQARCRG